MKKRAKQHKDTYTIIYMFSCLDLSNYYSIYFNELIYIDKHKICMHHMSREEREGGRTSG